MTTWKEIKLGEIADITMGQSPKSEYYNDKGLGTPFMQGNRTFGFKFPTFDTYTTVITKLAYPNDIIMSVRAPVGALNITPMTMCLGRGLCSLRSKGNNNQTFLYYLLKHYSNDLISKETGTVFGSVSYNDIANLYELNNQINSNLEQQAQALFKSWFIDFEPFGGKMPDDWKIGKLEELADITMGQSPNGSSYNENKQGCLFFQGRAEFGKRFPTIRLYTTEPKRMAKKNDILMSVRAPVGDFNIAIENCCIGRGLCSIRAKGNFQSFVLYTIWALQKQLEIFNGEGTVFGAINKDSLNSLSIIIPSLASIIKFENTASSLDNIIRTNFLENLRLAELRDSLLPKLMSGEIDVSKVDIEQIINNKD